jgi:DNA-binding Lrp family transcriptional regulator
MTETQKLPQSAERVLELLTERCGANKFKPVAFALRDGAEALQMSPGLVHNALRRLEAAGKIRRCGFVGRTQLWALTP